MSAKVEDGERDLKASERGLLGRTIKTGFFPMGPAAVTHEAILADTVAVMLGASPKLAGYEGLKDALASGANLKGVRGSDQDLLLQSVEELYTRLSTGARASDANRYVLPFHPRIAQCVQPKESRAWGQWYLMLMTDAKTRQPDFALHAKLVERLRKLTPSNILEEFILDCLKDSHYLQGEAMEVTSIRPYNADLAACFREDLASWLQDETTSSSEWLLGLGQLLTNYFLMDYIQLALNLHHEFEAVAQGQSYRPRTFPIQFGMWDEEATEDRQFRWVWNNATDIGIEQAIYNSWGHLATTRIISEQMGSIDWPDRISEAIADLSEMEAGGVLSALQGAATKLGAGIEYSKVGPAAAQLSRLITRHYQNKPKANQSPITMGISVVLQLGDARLPLIRSQRKIGKTFRLSKDLLAFFARVAHAGRDRPMHLQEFVKYLASRGIAMDGLTQQSLLENLEAIGMIERQSDSGDAVYVRVI